MTPRSQGDLQALRKKKEKKEKIYIYIYYTNVID